MPRLNTHKIEPKRGSTLIMCGSGNEAHDNKNYRYGGRLVDENLIVLRKRIHEMKMVERNYEPPSHWMDWEKNCYAGYDEFICEAMAVLQSRLMDTRPSLALGMAALVALSIPTSATVVLFHLIEISKGALVGAHIG